MNLENYHQEAKIIDLMKANLVALQYLIFFGIIFSVPFFIIWETDFSLTLFHSDSHFIQFLFPLLMMILGIIVHELIHGIFFALFATKGIRAVKFGILWKMMTSYCHCKEPLQIKHYTIALLAPFVLLGIIPSIISLFNGNFFLLIFGIIFYFQKK